MTENEIGTIVIESAISVHRELGPGLLETVYEVVLAHELRERKLTVQRQVPIAIEYKGIKFDEGFRADLIVHPGYRVNNGCVTQLAESRLLSGKMQVRSLPHPPILRNSIEQRHAF